MLTSQLNALIFRSTLTTSQAGEVQETLATDKKYARWWRPLGESGLLGWSENPADLAFFLQHDFGTEEIGLEHLRSVDVVDSVSARLQSGLAAVVMGRSVLGPHARLAAPTPETPDQFYLHDPKYPNTTGVYPMYELAQFQVTNTAFIF